MYYVTDNSEDKCQDDILGNIIRKRRENTIKYANENNLILLPLNSLKGSHLFFEKGSYYYNTTSKKVYRVENGFNCKNEIPLFEECNDPQILESIGL